MDNKILIKYEQLFISLKEIIKSSEARVLQENADELFVENVNFFVKSYLISICSYLEAYLQDIAFNHAEFINSKLKEAEISHNFIHWRLINGLKDKDLKFCNIDLSIAKKEISDNISANPYRTIKLFQLLGVDLSEKEDFEINKDLVNTIVQKRNNIVHHNNKATDVSFLDLMIYIDNILVYMTSINKSVKLVN
ncbi:MAG: HEPN domain-containing protein [Methylococcaceae bacterium]